MSEYLPQEVRDGLREAHIRTLSRKSRLRIRTGEAEVPVLKVWDTGFALEAGAAPNLRGLVDLYDGSRHLSQCLIIASSEEDGMMNYEFKRNTAASTSAPADYARAPDAPVALIGSSGE
ncbi:MAG: hypothetical protein AAGF74_16050 [Pseudomonadota bacterium]